VKNGCVVFGPGPTVRLLSPQPIPGSGLSELCVCSFIMVRKVYHGRIVWRFFRPPPDGKTPFPDESGTAHPTYKSVPGRPDSKQGRNR